MRNSLLAPLLLLAALSPPLAVAADNPLLLEERVQDIVAWVNDDIILWTDLQETEQAAIQQAMQEERSGDLSAAVQQVKERVLLQMIWDRLMVQEAERLFDMDAIKEDLLNRFMKSREIPSLEELDKMLGEYDLTREMLVDRLLVASAPDFVLDQQVRPNLGVSEDEAREFYEKNLAQFTTPGSVTFSEIVIYDETGEKEPLAREAAEQAAAGKDFAELVAKYSDSPSKGAGGRIGPVDPADLLPEIAQALGTTEPGGVTELIRSDKGWHLLRVEEKVEAKATDFAEVRTKCEQACRSAKFEPEFRKFVKGLWDESTIEVRKEFIDRVPEPWRSTVEAR